MRYRKLDANGDYSFGQGSQNFLINSPATVAQAVLTGLLLYLGEWFLDTSYGMPWLSQVVGSNTGSLYDAAIKAQILNTQGVTQIITYSSNLNRLTRLLTVNALLGTAYSAEPIAVSVGLPTGGYGIGGYGSNPYGT